MVCAANIPERIQAMSEPLSHYVFEDDGMYNNQWRIYEKNGKAFADAWSEKDAKELFDAVNAARAKAYVDSIP